jgi:hypothetical protein
MSRGSTASQKSSLYKLYSSVRLVLKNEKVFKIRQVVVKFKGSVQRKLRWVENGVNRSVGASDCGCSGSRRRGVEKVDKRMVLEYTHGLFIT